MCILLVNQIVMWSLMHQFVQAFSFCVSLQRKDRAPWDSPGTQCRKLLHSGRIKTIVHL